MLSKEDNELVTQVGPGTPMGNLMREYWVPAGLSSEFGRDGNPVRVLLLGERLIGYRDTNGRVGLMQDNCPHRGASMFFGRNEECGLRCVYHGWKFDVDGNCVDMPNEPAESNFKHKVKAVAYPCQERNGLIWTYMGSRETPPALPDLEANMLPEGEWTVQAALRECSWLQALEGDIDTSHLAFLHHGARKAEDTKPGTFAYYNLSDRAPRYEVVDTDYGAMYGAYRPAGEGNQYWRFAQYLFPFYVMIPSGVLGLQILDPRLGTHGRHPRHVLRHAGQEHLCSPQRGHQQPAAYQCGHSARHGPGSQRHRLAGTIPARADRSQRLQD